MRLEQPTYGRTTARKALFDVYTSIALRRVDKILCRTTAHLQYLHSVFHIPIEKLEWVPETTDPAFFSPGQPVQTLELQLPSGQPCIVSAGLEMRDYQTLIAAVRDLPVQLVIAAGSPWSHAQFEGPHNQKLPPNVLVSALKPAQMRELYRAATVVVVPVKPTLRACGMNVVLEGWAMQKPVIATRTVGLVDYITEGETGLFVRPLDAKDLRARITYLRERPDEAERLGRNGRRFVEQQLNVDRYVHGVSQIMSKLMQDRCH
jgi:glycosyltransferase involved in cell wall biosynthesis